MTKINCFDKYDLRDFVREQRTPIDKRMSETKRLRTKAIILPNFRLHEYGIFSGLTFGDLKKFTSFNEN